MKKATKKTSIFKKATALVVLCLGLNQTLNAQCNASYTYTATNSSISATSTSTGTVSSVEYNWTLNTPAGTGMGSAGPSSQVFSSLYNGAYTLNLSLLDSAGNFCSGSTQTITISGGVNAPACSSSFTYTLGTSGQVSCTNTSPADPLGNTVYMWNYGEVGSSNSTVSSNHTYYYNGTYSITLNVYNLQSGCSTSSTQTLTITNAAGGAIPACTSNFTYTVGAAGEVSFTSPFTGSTTGNSVYNWLFEPGNGSNLQNPSYTYSYNGTYSVTLSITDSLANCYSSSTQTLTIGNTVNPPCIPTVNFYLHQDSLNPQPGIWQVSTYYSPQVTSAVWSWGDGTSTNGLSPMHTYTTAGQYNICVTVYAACGDSAYVCQNDTLFRLANGANSIISVSVLNVNNVTGIKNISKETAQLNVYPNPGSGLFTLNLGNVSSATKAQISISNILGEVIYSTQEPVNNNTLTKAIDLQSIANGAYFMKVVLGDKIYSNKLIKN